MITTGSPPSITATHEFVVPKSIPVLIISIGLIIKNVKPRFEVMQGKIDNLNTTVQENLIGIRVVKSFVRRNKEKEKFKASNDNLLQASEGAFSIVVLNMPIMQVVMQLFITRQ